MAVSALATAATLVAGPGATAGLVVAALAVAYASLAIAFVAPARPSRRFVLNLGLMLLVLAVVRPPTASHDVWSYAMYGRIAAHYGLSPYLHAPKEFVGDPLFTRVDPLWVGTRCVYGPLFTAWSTVLAWIGGGSALFLRLGFQLTAAVAVVSSAFLVDRRTGGDVRALLLLVVNPLVVCSLVNDAHADALVGLAVLVAVLLTERSRHGAAGAALGLGVLVKVTALLPVGALGLWLLSGRRLRPAARFAAGVLVVVGVGYGVGGGRAAVRPLGASSAHLTWASVWGPARGWLTSAQVRRGLPHHTALLRVGHTLGLAASCAVIAATVGLVLANRARAAPALVAGAAVLAYMLLGGYVLPWYAGAGLSVLALQHRWPPTWIFVAHAGLLQLAEVPGRRFLHRLPPGASTASWHQLFQRSVLPPLEAALVLLVILSMRRGLEPAAGPS